MRFAESLAFLIAAVATFGMAGWSSMTFAKTVEAGDGGTSWMGTGEVLDTGKGKQVVNGTLKGVMFVRHSKGAVRGPIHATKLECPVRVVLDKEKNRRESVGVCTLVAHEGQDIAYGLWKCAGALDECEGEFTSLPGARVDSAGYPERHHSGAVSISNGLKAVKFKPSGMRIGRISRTPCHETSCHHHDPVPSTVLLVLSRRQHTEYTLCRMINTGS
ncbi:hypothetical protein [Candidatus Nitrospira bockiana]